MAVDGYIQAAHSQLTSAVTELQSEISQLQRQLSQQKGSMESDINRLNAERNVDRVEVGQQGQDAAQHNLLLKRLQTISSEQDQKKAEISKLENEIIGQIQAKQQAMGSIQSAANQINGLLSVNGVR